MPPDVHVKNNTKHPRTHPLLVAGAPIRRGVPTYHQSLSQVDTFKIQINSKLRMRQHALVPPFQNHTLHDKTLNPVTPCANSHQNQLCFTLGRRVSCTSRASDERTRRYTPQICHFTTAVRVGWLKVTGRRPPNSITTMLAAAVAAAAAAAAVWKPGCIRAKFRQQQQQRQQQRQQQQAGSSCLSKNQRYNLGLKAVTAGLLCVAVLKLFSDGP